MPLLIACRCSYFVGSYTAGTPDHVYASNKYIKALKGRPINGWASVPVDGTDHRLDSATRGEAVAWFGRHSIEILNAAGVEPPYSLVPIPSSNAVAGTDAVPRTLALAQAIRAASERGDVTIADVLRWDEEMVPASKNGPRFADEVYPHVVLLNEVRLPRRLVLVDDVLTSGGHMKAVRAKLMRAGAHVDFAVCAGRTVHEQPEDSWAVVWEVLDDWGP